MLFSVIIPTRNRASSLLEAVESVRRQSFTDWELIIVDDGSTDGTEEVIRPHLSEKIRYIKNPRPLGPGASRNVGIRHADTRSRFISLLDDDDLCYPEFLQTTWNNLKDTGDEIGFSWTAVDFYDLKTGKTTQFFWDPPFLNREDAFAGFLVQRLIGTGYGITFKKIVFAKTGYFDENLKAVEDTDFFLRVLKSFFYVKIPSTLVRITRNNALHVNADSVEKAEGLTAILLKHKGAIVSNRKAWYNFNAKISSIYYRLGNRKKGRKILLDSLRDKPDIGIFLLLLRLELVK